jgi:hypothetical protein
MGSSVPDVETALDLPSQGVAGQSAVKGARPGPVPSGHGLPASGRRRSPWGRPMRGDDFKWGEGNGNVVLRAYGSVAVHENPYGDLVIRQERDALEDEDHFVVVPVQDAELIAKAIVDKAKEIKEGPHYVNAERRAAARGTGVHAHRCQPPWEWRALKRDSSWGAGETSTPWSHFDLRHCCRPSLQAVPIGDSVTLFFPARGVPDGQEQTSHVGGE